LQTYAGSASQNFLRTALVNEDEVKGYDGVLRAWWEWLAKRQLDEKALARLLGLLVKMGGIGVQWAADRRAAAFCAAWSFAAA
jgi:hypothetical protein